MPENDKAPASAKADEPEKHTVEALIEGSQAWMGYSPHLAAGALSGQTRARLTIDEATKIVKKFAEAPIVKDEPEEASA